MNTIRLKCKNSYFVIEGPETKSPSNFMAELKNIHFKQALVKFVMNYWATSKEAANIIGPNRVVYLNYEFCYSYRVVNNTVIRTLDSDYSCTDHEEADTKIVYHACKIPGNIMIRCNDTDILIIMLSNMMHATNSNKIIM